MSVKQDTVIIKPDSRMRKLGTEQFSYFGYTCPYCSGNGFFWGVNELGERVKQACSLCRGKKELDAVVTVEWRLKND